MLVLNQYYWPGVEATAHLLSELCEALVDDFEITIVAGRLRGFPGLPKHEERNGVDIVRVESAAFDRAHMLLRGANYATYLAQALRAGLASPPPDVVLCMTDPPMVADVGLAVARRHRAPLVVISQDVFPEIAVQLNRLENPLLVQLLRVLVNFYLRRADRVVAIGETMRRRLEAKGTPSKRIRVIPNWVDTAVLHPEPRDNAWARENGLADKFVVMHSGNVGHAQDLASLIRAATLLRDIDDLRIVVVGTGARHSELVALAERLEVESVQFLPYQPRERLSESLSSADVHVVGLVGGLAGFVVPSRLYGVLATGRPVIAAAEDSSETADIVRRVGCGVVVPPGRPDRLAEAIRELRERKGELDALGARGRDYVVAEANREVAVRKYATVLHEVVAAR
jgi:glycosyltransferase involved in cell wall biosynthesis